MTRTSIPRLRSAALCFALCGPVWLCGCAARRLRVDYTSFEGAYADTSNQEVLLNLARLNQHDPTYFFKLGQIATSYHVQAGISGSAGYVTQGTTGTNIVGSGGPSLEFYSNPQFTFIPVNDDTTAQLLLKPIPAELFYVMYQQGWRADQLFRLMVDRIEIREPGKPWEVIHNVPSIDNALDYTRFLRVSALAYELQTHGFLLLRGRQEFEPSGAQSTKPPTAQDVLNAQGKNLVWRNEGGMWQLGQEVVTPYFYLNPNKLTQDDVTEIQRDMPQLDVGGINGVTALQQVLDILQHGFTIQENPNFTTEAATSLHSANSKQRPVEVHLILRSLIGMMAAAAQEQAGFANLMKTNPTILSNHFQQLVPLGEQRPILQLTWSPETSVIPPLVKLSYRNQTYMITDASNPQLSAGVFTGMTQYSWNQDVFRLICLLTAQVTVDISKFPLPEVLQLQTN